MKSVFRLKGWELKFGQPQQLIVKCGRPSVGPTLCRILKATFPGLIPVEQKSSGIDALTGQVRINLLGKIPIDREISDLMRSMKGMLTVCDSADVSHCLSLHRIPIDDVPSDEWPHTKLGLHVRDAKYRGEVSSANEVARVMGQVIADHPAFKGADAIASMPSSGKHFDAPAHWRQTIAQQRGLQQIAIRRTRPTEIQKDIVGREERVKNQQDSMECGDVKGLTVIILDDLYMDGATMDEAVRALRAAGAGQVLALCAVKTARGTSGGVGDFIPPEAGGESA